MRLSGGQAAGILATTFAAVMITGSVHVGAALDRQTGVFDGKVDAFYMGINDAVVNYIFK